MYGARYWWNYKSLKNAIEKKNHTRSSQLGIYKIVWLRRSCTFLKRAWKFCSSLEVGHLNRYFLKTMLGERYKRLSTTSMVNDGQNNFLYGTEYLKHWDFEDGFSTYCLPSFLHIVWYGASIILLKNRDSKMDYTMQYADIFI